MNIGSFPKNNRILYGWAVVMLSFSLLGLTYYYTYAPPPQVLELTAPFEPERGYAYQVSLSDLGTWPFTAVRGDRSGHNSRSKVKLFEDGHLLGPPHSVHQRIRTAGGGRFSHWGERLVFSTSDNTDPNTNGREYQIQFSVVPATELALVAATLIVVTLLYLGGMYFGRRRWIMVLASAAAGIGVVGLTLNLMGILFPPDLPNRYPSRPNDTTWTYPETLAHIGKVRADFSFGQLTEIVFVREMMIAVNRRMTNIHRKYLQTDSALRVPLTQNWLLWLAGFHPRFRDYDFADPYHSLRRGLGMCDVQSKTLARLLKEDGLKTGIWGGNVHVVSWVETTQGHYFVDPDYGVMVAGTPDNVSLQQPKVMNAYRNMLQQGVFEKAVDTIKIHYFEGSNNYNKDIEVLDKTSKMTRKFMVERYAFILKWLLPIALLLPLAILLLARSRRQARKPTREDLEDGARSSVARQ